MDPHRVLTPVALTLCSWAFAACAGPFSVASSVPATSPVAPAASAPRGSWHEDLAFSGQIRGTLTSVVPDSDTAPDGCTGSGSTRAGSWASSFYGQVGGTVYGVVVTVATYRGPGVYQTPQVSVQVLRPDGSQVWQTQPGDAATFTVDADQLSGTLNATLTNLETGTGTLHVSGTWACQV